MKTGDIQIRDPFIFPDAKEKLYYLFGTTKNNRWKGEGEGEGFDCFKSRDLIEWEGPIPVFRPAPSFWGTCDFWASEVHQFRNRYCMFASFNARQRYRGTQILIAERIAGPYVPLTDRPVTPPDWGCLDGTLHVDNDGCPWIVFCHEWTQVHNGAIYAMRLADDLREAVAPPVFLFNASEAPWVRRPAWPEDSAPCHFPTYVTDGPFLFRTKRGVLLMLWSSFGETGYALGVARSETAGITGPWRQDAFPLWAKDGGHGMLFRHFDGRLFLTFHCPNRPSEERPVFLEIEEIEDHIQLKSSGANRTDVDDGK